jgi:hypothetical protein
LPNLTAGSILLWSADTDAPVRARLGLRGCYRHVGRKHYPRELVSPSSGCYRAGVKIWHVLVLVAVGIFVAVRISGATGADKIVYDVLAGVCVIAFVLHLKLSEKLEEIIKLLKQRQ